MKRLGRPSAIGLSLLAGLAAGLVLVLVSAGPTRGQQFIQYGFENREPVWAQGPHDAAFKEIAHRLTDETKHDGQRCETIQLMAENGSFIHYTYPVGRAPITEDLTVSLFVRANRPGIQLLARVVFPKAKDDPQNPDQPVTALLQGERYQVVGRWQQLTLRQPVKLLDQQRLLLSNNLKREISATGAYIDQLVLNVYAGPGDTKVWLDDLEIGPVDDRAAPLSGSPGQTTGREAVSRPAVNRRPDEIQLKNKDLLVGGERFFLLGIRHTGTPLPVLRRAGFNTVWLDETTPEGLIEDAASLGFWIVPTLHAPELAHPSGGGLPGQLTSSNEAFSRNVSRFLNAQAVLCWDLGANLPSDKVRPVLQLARAFRTADPMRPLAADVSDGMSAYAKTVDNLMLGAHRWPLLTSLELPAYREWLLQRRRLSEYRELYFWTWIQTHLPDWFTRVAYEQDSTGRFSEPLGPHPEQIRLLAYLAVAAGYRGLGFWSDRFLADSHSGRDRLLALAVLNQEFRLLEPLLVAAKEPQWIGTTNPNVMAAVLRTDKAVLVLPMWVGPGAQYVPPQGAAAVLKITVPLVPDNYQAWEVSPGRFRSYPCKRTLGGTEVTLQNFGLTSAIVFTADLGPTGLVVRFQEQQRDMRKDAAQWTYDQAQEELAKAARIHRELEDLSKAAPGTEKVLDRARAYLEESRRYRLAGLYSEGYSEAQQAMREVRILMRADWDAAVKPLSTPVASPYAVSYFTLPRHYRFVEELSTLRPTPNVLPDGDFEAPPDRVPPNWLVKEILPPPNRDGEAEVETTAKRVAEQPHEGKQCLMLKAAPKNPLLPPAVVERLFLAIHTPAVRLPPGSLVRISACVRVPKGVAGSPDGALFYDSIGGEPLAVRLTAPGPWKRFVLYRRVPPSGKVSATLALTGLGTVYFDDVRIEPMMARGASDDIATAPAAPKDRSPEHGAQRHESGSWFRLPWSKER